MPIYTFEGIIIEVIDVLNGKMRGQAAMEYLMTYGWALLVIVVVIAILLIINPLQPPAGCRFDQVSFTCTNPLVDTHGKLYLSITNGNNNAIKIYDLKCVTEKSPTPPLNPSTTLITTLQRQEPYEILPLPCTTGGSGISPSAGTDFSGKLWVYYKNEEDGASYPVRTISANVVAKVSQA